MTKAKQPGDSDKSGKKPSEKTMKELLNEASTLGVKRARVKKKARSRKRR